MPLHNAMKEETVPETQTPFEKPICFKLKTHCVILVKLKAISVLLPKTTKTNLRCIRKK